MKHLVLPRLCIALLLALGACGTPAIGQPYQVVSTPGLTANSTIPAPTGNVILTITGNISSKNIGDALQLDLATLEQFGSVQYTTTDPFQNKDITYSGVLLSDLLTAVRAAPDATVVNLTALDDYEASIPIADIQKMPILLATSSNGVPLSIEDGGPSRVVYPYHLYPDLNTIDNHELWIWNVKSMEIR